MYIAATYLNDSLSQEIITFSGEFLAKFRFYVVIFVPDSDLDAVARVVTFAVNTTNYINTN